MRPILHEDNLLVPEFPSYVWKMEFEDDSSTEALYLVSDNQLVPDKMSSGQKLFNQQQFTSLINYISLSKDKT